MKILRMVLQGHSGLSSEHLLMKHSPPETLEGFDNPVLSLVNVEEWEIEEKGDGLHERVRVTR